jgi:hypothetical protein
MGLLTWRRMIVKLLTLTLKQVVSALHISSSATRSVRFFLLLVVSGMPAAKHL